MIIISKRKRKGVEVEASIKTKTISINHLIGHKKEAIIMNKRG
jgi:hypothetical protein